MLKRQKNTLVLVLVSLLLVVGAVLAMVHREKQQVADVGENLLGGLKQDDHPSGILEAEAQTSGVQITTEVNTQQLPDLPSFPDRFSTEEDLGVAPDLQVFEIEFTNNGFSPSVLVVKKGDIVQFVNSTSSDMLIFSDPHPSHSRYPGFNIGKPISPEDRSPLQFNEVGEWTYHNEMDLSFSGKVIVEP